MFLVYQNYVNLRIKVKINSILMVKKDKLTAGLLAILAGSLGVHRFYLNQVGLGLVYLFVFLPFCGISSIISLIDGIVILSMSDEAFDKKYNAQWLLEQNSGFVNSFYSNQNQQDKISIETDLLRLESLFDNGSITFEEYEKRKTILMKRRG